MGGPIVRSKFAAAIIALAYPACFALGVWAQSMRPTDPPRLTEDQRNGEALITLARLGIFEWMGACFYVLGGREGSTIEKAQEACMIDQVRMKSSDTRRSGE